MKIWSVCHIVLNDNILILYVYMQGLNYPCASKVPVEHRSRAFSSVMNTLAKLHGYRWVHYSTEEKMDYLESAEFFRNRVLIV